MRLVSGGADASFACGAYRHRTSSRRGVTEDDGQTPVPVTSLTFSKDGKEVLYTGGGTNGRAGLLVVQTGKKRVEFKRHNSAVTSGSLSPTGPWR